MINNYTNVFISPVKNYVNPSQGNWLTRINLENERWNGCMSKSTVCFRMWPFKTVLNSFLLLQHVTVYLI